MSCMKECFLIFDLLFIVGKVEIVLYLILKINGILFCKKVFLYIYLIIYLKLVLVNKVINLLVFKDLGLI